ncbi:MAG: hypothetical protein KC431_16475 [Myxococcales bacterium]|nr:hypothetical protein [Myxococcales bacterium]
MRFKPRFSPASLLSKPLLAALLASLATGLVAVTATADPQPEPLADHCATLDEHGHPKYCAPVGPDMAPWWDASACCQGTDCVEPGADGCDSTNGEEVHCRYAELAADGALTCLYEVPGFCEVYDCDGRESDPTAPPEPEDETASWVLCCYGMDNCYAAQGGPCGGDVIYCYQAVTNADGTSECLDGTKV